ncbi:MAG: hypothetical protein A2W93_14270 [Bacteroidetes bacterium GWF2_43_63]|nr:MAG: hypothetical protein A2W94_00840 [Bacteroidetes bacterium GWE2_42_42]OFY52506.1 MAG: hypothetical protein A2W93_14270 [Bacteroidetes bacterium GWF2_43_63]HBG71413.1 hypothetical protein [Bacteroidales bacterium]HCB60835.1 hypothetical protein [Bacteroidales bacterium]HCY23440.1 hypothetical protein [Bacteroidales bacterium]
MKKLFFVVILALAVFSGCKKDEPEAVEGVLTVSPTVWYATNNSGQFYVDVESNTDWTVYPDNGFYPIQSLNASPLSGSGNGSVKIEYGAASYPTPDLESATIYFKYKSFGVDKSTSVKIDR